MDRIRSAIKTKIHVESEQLVMCGHPSESSGCVLRGVLDVRVKEPTKVKGITLQFSGKMTITWTEPVTHGHERMFQDERTLINHTWSFLPKSSSPHQLDSGSYSYEFELPLPGDLPESTHVISFYLVQYRLKATVQRTRLLPNNTSSQVIHLSRQLLPLTPEFLEPVIVSNQWTNKLDYEISIPSKTYCHGEIINISIRVTPLVSNLRIRYLTCTLKEYMMCRATSGWFGGHSRTQSRVVNFERDEKFGSRNSSGDESFIVWSKDCTIAVPMSNHQVQCDVQNDNVRIRHKIKFVISIENPDGHVSELRAALPVFISPTTVTTGLPSYEEAFYTLPYDPALMVSLINHRTATSDGGSSDGRSSNGRGRQRRSWSFFSGNDRYEDESRDEDSLSSYPSPTYIPSTSPCSTTDLHASEYPFPSSSTVNAHLPTYDELLCMSR